DREEVRSWWSPPPLEIMHASWTQLPKEDFSPVPQDRCGEAVRMLETTSFVELTEEQAHELLDSQPPRDLGCKPFIMRGLSLKNYYVMREVRSRQHAVWVYHSAMPGGPAELIKEPVVVWLPFEPDQVYVSGSINGW